MPNTCCAVGCSNHGRMLKKLSFFTFPNDEERREKWISAVKRVNSDGTKWLPSKYTVLCSDHFIQGKPNRDPAHPDFVPSLFGHVKTTPKETDAKLKRFASAVKRKIAFSTPIPAKRQRKVLSPLVENVEEVYFATPLNSKTGYDRDISNTERYKYDFEINSLRTDKDNLKSENNHLKEQVKCANLSYKSVVDDDDKCKFYTGLSWETF
ncbi:THAP domain-containing protein 6-like [Mercenaria mercenaria]|uniref:THAP domain-containing protein 6-like n=1 Tax=Mercenaria mercenaria TaxID=6596 RepID=UPI00234E4F9A|nr:THAP domain-containing protein 6-like [Mercenaria mercenaria]